MDGSRFDRVARTLAAGATRRQALLGVTSGAMASLLGLAGVEDAAAGCVKPGKKGQGAEAGNVLRRSLPGRNQQEGRQMRLYRRTEGMRPQVRRHQDRSPALRGV